MAWFSLRKKNGDTAPPWASAAQAAAVAPPESVETVKRQARQRLIGAVVLLIAALVGFPLLFDKQPRPVALDIPIEIPNKNSVKPLELPPARNASSVASVSQPAPEPAAPSANPPVKSPAQVAAKASLGDGEQLADAPPIAPPTATPKPAASKPARPASKPVVPTPAKPEPKPEAKPDAKAADAARALAILEGKSASKAASAAATPADAGARFVVQFGSFSEAPKAREVRQKVERAGLKTYAQIANTSEGERIRVRVGPFASRAEAEKAASKIKSLDLPANILEL